MEVGIVSVAMDFNKQGISFLQQEITAFKIHSSVKHGC